MGEILVHPAITTTPELIWALQERLGLRAVVDGRRVRLIGMPRWCGRPPVAAERRAGMLFLLPRD